MSTAVGPDAMLAGRQLLIFDFDGTVADTSPLHAAAFEQVLKPYGVRVDYPSIAGLKTRDALKQCLESAGVGLDEDRVSLLAQEKQRVVRAMINDGLTSLPGVDDFLQWARPRYAMSMVTSGSRATVELAMRALGYEDIFDPLICAEDVVKSKPDPEGFLMALQQTGFSPSEALIFEDSDAGVVAARLAGIDCWDVRQRHLEILSLVTGELL